MTSPNRLTVGQAIAELSALERDTAWDDPRVTQRDVLHRANVILLQASTPRIQAAWERVLERCDERFQTPTAPSRHQETT